MLEGKVQIAQKKRLVARHYAEVLGHGVTFRLILRPSRGAVNGIRDR